MKTINLTPLRAGQLAKLAESKDTTPAKLVDSWIARELLSDLNEVLNLDTDLEMLTFRALGAEEAAYAADCFTPPGWCVVGLHKGGEEPLVLLSMNSDDKPTSIEAQHSIELGDLIRHVAQNNGAGQVQCTSDRIAHVRRVGRSVLISIEDADSNEISRGNLSGSLAVEFGAAMQYAAQSAIGRAEGHRA